MRNRGVAATAASSTQTQTPPPLVVGNAVAHAMYALYTADAVAFDVDSTVIAEEGIDVLADYLGMGEEVATLTRNAMEGSTKFQDALQARLNLLKPSRKQIETLLQERPAHLTPGIQTLVDALYDADVDVWLVSGGFRIMIDPIAVKLGIDPTHVYANTILFDEDSNDGSYVGFDDKEPTSRDMGKPAALHKIIERSNGRYQTVVMVGDGATDMQAKPPATAFIGFGGVVEREAVKVGADWYVTSFEDMTHVVRMRQQKKKK